MTPPLRPLFVRGSIVITDGGNSDNLGQERHRILRELQRELGRHPAVQGVTGSPDDNYRELRATLDPAVLGVEAEEATLRVTWWPTPDDPEYAFHYLCQRESPALPVRRACSDPLLSEPSRPGRA